MRQLWVLLTFLLGAVGVWLAGARRGRIAHGPAPSGPVCVGLCRVLRGSSLWIFPFSLVSRVRFNRGADGSTAAQIASILSGFLQGGGIAHIFPGDSARDTSVQFELISQVTGVTTVGRPISVMLRNAPTTRGSFSPY